MKPFPSLLLCVALSFSVHQTSIASGCFAIGDSSFCDSSYSYATDEDDMAFTNGGINIHPVRGLQNSQETSGIPDTPYVETGQYRVISRQVYQTGSSYCQVIGGRMYCD